MAEQPISAEQRLAEDLADLFEVHELNPGDRLDRSAVEQLGEILADHAARIDSIGCYDQDRFPVIVDVTQRYVVWVEAENAADALASVKDDGAWYERLEGEQAITSWPEVSAPDGYEMQSDVYADRFGPARQCPQCNRPPYATGVLHVVHASNCPALAQDGTR